MKELLLKSVDGYELTVHVFEVKNPKAVIEVAHGMEEHQERYEDFVKFLNDNGFTVVTADMRGHGKNADILGYFHADNASDLLVQDQLVIANYIKENYKDVDLYLFAHSMGTIISRNTMLKNSKMFKKICLCGYPNYQAAAGIGRALAKMIKAFKGATYKSNLLESMSVGAFNKSVENPKTNVDWLSYNEENVQNYINDPLCGAPFSTSAYITLFTLLINMNKASDYVDIDENTPILCISGSDDPCTGGVKGTESSINTLKNAGFKNIKKITYDHMRHEILNEVEHEKVYKDVVDFYNS